MDPMGTDGNWTCMWQLRYLYLTEMLAISFDLFQIEDFSAKIEQEMQKFDVMTTEENEG